MFLNFRMEGGISTKTKNWMIWLWVCFCLDGVSWKMWERIGRFVVAFISPTIARSHVCCIVMWFCHYKTYPFDYLGYYFWEWPEWPISLLALCCLPCLPLVTSRVLGCMDMCVSTHDHVCRCDGGSGVHRYISSLSHREAVQGLETQGL